MRLSIALGLVLIGSAAPAAAAGKAKIKRNWTYSAEGLETRKKEAGAWRHSLEKKSKDKVEAEIAAQAKKRKPPVWAGKSSWTEIVDGKEYLLGVGMASNMRNRGMAITVAEDRGRAEIAKALNTTVTRKETPTSVTVTTESRATLRDAVAIDWYVSPDGTWSALIAMKR